MSEVFGEAAAGAESRAHVPTELNQLIRLPLVEAYTHQTPSDVEPVPCTTGPIAMGVQDNYSTSLVHPN